jgi:hypothetical protein
MEAVRLTAAPAGALSGDQLDAVRRLYEEAFPAALRVPFAELAEPGPDGRLIAGLDGGIPVGFAALRVLGSAGWVFLRYFGIAADRRRQGAGRRLWELLPGAWPAGWPGRVAFEVEDPAEAAGAERQIRRDRVSFWRGCGPEQLAVPGYAMPDFTGALGAAAEPMLLMAAPACAGGELRRLVLAIYTDRYGLAPQDPLVRRALESVSG